MEHLLKGWHKNRMRFGNVTLFFDFRFCFYLEKRYVIMTHSVYISCIISFRRLSYLLWKTGKSRRVAELCPLGPYTPDAIRQRDWIFQFFEINKTAYERKLQKICISEKIEKSHRIAESRPVCVDLQFVASFPSDLFRAAFATLGKYPLLDTL